jgi:hypothetical protein
MNLLYLTFGDNISNHMQAQFSIYSFLSQKHELNVISVITDEPAFYNNVKDEVNIITINKETLINWEGPYKFFWRVKIKAIELICSMYRNEPVIYLDSDTFLYGDLKALAAEIKKGSAFMHENEGQLSTAKGKTVKKMWAQVKGKVYANTTILPIHEMWNAGVIATPNTRNNKECKLALDLTDEMCKRGVTRRLVEQFALSVSLHQTYGLQEANNIIAHYWSNKESWNNAIGKFFLSACFRSYTSDQTLEAIKNFDFSELAVKVKLKNTNKRLKTLTDKLFPNLDVSFINGSLKQN